jgi:putative addiction module killer protein
MDYNTPVLIVQETDVFTRWMTSLRDRQARARIGRRIDRLALGNFGDVKNLGDGISELHIDYGPGYRVYFTATGRSIILLLCAGDKRTQDRDIAKAKRLAGQAKE